MAVITFAQFPVGFLPAEVSRGPFPEIAHLAWWTVRISLIGLAVECIGIGKNEAGMTWYGKLERSFS